MQDWMVLESDLHPTVLQRMARNLREAKIEHRVDGQAILLPDDERTREAVGILDLLIDCHGRIMHHADPERARPYKPLERDIILIAAHEALRNRDGQAEFLAHLLSGLVWAQGLPNTNHRSTLLLVNRLAHADAASLRDEMARFISASKPLIREREFEPKPERLRPAHLDVARRYVAALNLPSGR